MEPSLKTSPNAMRTSTEKDAAQAPLDAAAAVPYNEKSDQTVLDNSRDTSHERLDKIDPSSAEDGSLNESEDKPAAIQIPWKYRLTAIILIILFGTGNTYLGFVMGPLKTRLVKKLKISSESSLDESRLTRQTPSSVSSPRPGL